MFKKIVIVEPIFMEKECEKELEKYCNELIIYDTNVKDEKETTERIGNADCVLVSWSTTISKEIIERCTNLKHTVDVISINVNRDVCLIGGNNLEKYGNGKAIINTSIGKCYDLGSLKSGLKIKGIIIFVMNLQ